MTTPIVSMQLAEIAEVVGVNEALRLSEAFGGQEGCNVPKTPRPDHPWVQPLGWEAFCKLCQAYGGGRIDIPRNAFAKTVKAKMAELKQRGLSHRAIALQLRCTERYVRMVMNEGQDDRQGSLF